MAPAVEVKDLRKTYKGGVEALKGIDLEVRQGEFLGLLGPNGAGKTTTIGIITGLVRSTAGSATVMGHDVVSDFRDARRCIGLAAQDLNFDWFFPIEELMVLQAGYYGIERKVAVPRAKKLLQEFGLESKAAVKPRELSGGMKRRLQIARSLIHDPEILILDEPTAGVDVELRRMLWGYLTKLNEGGKTIILTTHYIEEAELLCERVAIIDGGEIVTQGTPRELVGQNKKGCIEVILEQWLPEYGGVLKDFQHKVDGNTLKIKVAKPESRLAEVISLLAAVGAVVQNVSIKKATLEDVFMELTGHSFDE
ncbi:ATP-binding cassette domain-containing protein [Candidatus Neomarinimicrobiota bacterium]